MTVVYEKLINEIEALLQLYITNQRILSNTTQPANLHGVLEAMMTLRRSRDVGTAATIVTKVCFKILFVIIAIFFLMTHLFFSRLLKVI